MELYRPLQANQTKQFSVEALTLLLYIGFFYISLSYDYDIYMTNVKKSFYTFC